MARLADTSTKTAQKLNIVISSKALVSQNLLAILNVNHVFAPRYLETPDWLSVSSKIADLEYQCCSKW